MVAPENLVTRYWYDLARARYGEFAPVTPLDKRGRVHRIGFVEPDTQKTIPAVVKYVSNSINGRMEIAAAQKFSGWVGPEVYSVSEVEGNLEMIMEKGIGTLQNLRTFSLRDPQEQYDALRSLANLMATLEESGYGHFDLKPQNVLVCSDQEIGGHLKLADFGGTMPHYRFRWMYALKPLSIGTPGYIPPECFDHDRYCASSVDASPTAIDMYAFGVIAYYLAKGCLPAKELSLHEDSASARKKHAEIMLSHDYRTALLSLSVDNVHPKIGEMVYECTAPHPAARPRSFMQLRDILY